MKKRGYIFFAIVLLFMLAIMIVRAQNIMNSEKVMMPSEKSMEIAKLCEAYSYLRDRIKCRLNEGIESFSADNANVPEACKTVKNIAACVALLKKASDEKCYDLKEGEKTKCLKVAAGFVKAKLSDEPSSNKAQKVRNYLVLLLADLEQRLAKANSEGKISNDMTAEISELIVRLKQDILDKKSKAAILLKLKQLKEKWSVSNIK